MSNSNALKVGILQFFTSNEFCPMWCTFCFENTPILCTSYLFEKHVLLLKVFCTSESALLVKVFKNSNFHLRKNVGSRKFLQNQFVRNINKLTGKTTFIMLLLSVLNPYMAKSDALYLQN